MTNAHYLYTTLFIAPKTTAHNEEHGSLRTIRKMIGKILRE